MALGSSGKKRGGTRWFVAARVSVTPGQIAVAYVGDTVVAGGKIR